MAGKGSVVISIDGDASKFEKVLGSVATKSKRVISGIGTVAGGVAKGATLVYGAVSAAMSVAGVASVKYNASIEQLQTSFETMTGSAEKAAEVVGRLRTMGAETPFETADLAKVTQLLMQYGFTADDALEKMRMLGDIAQGNTQAMESIATGYAQMASAGKVNLQDIKQMINGGFNPLQEISERTGESMTSLYDRISKGTMAVEEITESMRYATSEGGKFYQSMEKQSQTLNGQLSTLKDNLSSFGGMIFEPISDKLRDALIPDANAILGDLQSAYEKAGLDGLVDAVNRQIPRLTEAGMSAATKLFAAIGKRMPGLVKSLLSNLPTLLSSAVDLAPQLADTFFAVVSASVERLASMIPDLAPILGKGVLSLAQSVYKGVESTIAGLFTGIEQAMHKGQSKIAGMWVDDSEVAKYNFDMEIDISAATSAIQTAYSEIRAALQSDLLDDDQRKEIEDMIGEDYDAIYEKLKSFSLSDEDAGAIAQSITDAGDTLIEAFSGLNVGIDAETLARLTAQANGSRIVLKGLLKDIGLEDDDIQQVIAVYDEMIGKVGAETPSIIEEIYDKLTDGEPDDDQTVSALKEKITDYISTLLSDLETAYAAKSAELDTTAEDYKAKKAELDEWYASTKTSITEMNYDMTALVDELAGAPTAVVQARLDEFAEMERQLLGLEEKIDSLNAKAQSQAEAAFKVVRSGAQADEITISTAIKYKVEKFKLDEQSAEDAYNEAVTDLNSKFASGEIGQEEFNVGMESATATRDAGIKAAKQSFNQAFYEIMQGIAESQGTSEVLNAALKAMENEITISDLMESLIDVEGNIDMGVADQLSQALASVLGDAFDADTFASYIQQGQEGNINILQTQLDMLMTDVQDLTTDQFEAALGGKVRAAWVAALQDGMLTGTDFDVTTAEDQLRALFEAINVSDVGNDIIAGVGKGMASADISTDAARVESNTENALRSAFNSHSPAQTMVPIGNDVAAGVGQGMSEYDFSGDSDAMAQGAKSAAGSALNGSGNSAGRMFSAGIARGILSGRSNVVNAAVSIARAAVYAIRRELQIASPSKVTMQLGRYTGQGFEQGMVESLNDAIRSAQSVVGSMNLTPRLSAPDLSSAFASAAGSIADAEGSRPIYLNVNGRTLATVTAADTRRAQNSYNRSIALGVGK